MKDPLFKVGDLIVRTWVSESQKRRVAYSFKNSPNSPHDLCIIVAIDNENEMIKVLYIPSLESSVLPLSAGYLKVVREG